MSPAEEILAMLDASATLTVVPEGAPTVKNGVYWGNPTVDRTTKVITLPLPYLVFNASPGYDRDPRFNGTVAGRVFEFRLQGIGQSEQQALWVLNEASKVLSRKRLGRSLIKRRDINAEARRDDDYTRPGGKPLFSASDKYGVGV